MFVMDVPYVPPTETPVVLAQATVGSAPAVDYILNQCQHTQSTGDPRTAVRAVDPAGWLRNYLEGKENRVINDLSAFKLTLLEPTKVGTLTKMVYNDKITWYRYDAPEGYVGRDRAIFLAEFEGKRYKIVLDLRVFKIFNENSSVVCPQPTLIEVKKPKSSLPPAPIGFAPLDGGALAQTTGTTITLSPTAANHGWFIDPTPGSNVEFLPTSNANEWIAKEISAAYATGGYSYQQLADYFEAHFTSVGRIVRAKR